MTTSDRERWDQKWRNAQATTETKADAVGPPSAFADHAALLAAAETGLELACGVGRSTVWLASNGVDMVGVDVSAVAIQAADQLAASAGVGDRCRFIEHDLDEGLPAGDPVDLVLCHMFRDRRLDHEIVNRLVPGGVLAIAVLSEVGAKPGRFRSPAGALTRAFAALSVIDAGEAAGRAWLLARRQNDSAVV